MTHHKSEDYKLSAVKNKNIYIFIFNSSKK